MFHISYSHRRAGGKEKIMEIILQVIQSVGFPIACCVFLGYFIKKQSDEYREDVKDITEKYNEAIKDFRKALERNTIVLSAIDKKLEKGEEHD